MSMPSELDLTTLNREVSQLETEAARLEIERAAQAKTAAALGLRQRYLHLAKWFRALGQAFPAYPLAVFAIGPLALGVIALVALSWLFSVWSLAWVGFLVAGLAGWALFAWLLYRPSDTVLPTEIAAVDAKLRVESARLQETISAIAELHRRLATLQEHRRELAKSDKLQRAMLLQRSWKTMRGGEWEDYVVEVCRTLGANVQRAENPGGPPAMAALPARGPRGVIRRTPTTLFVTFSPRRIAVAAISEINPFHAAAVQQVVNELAQKGCDELGIVTNARLTAGSKEFARSRRCTLIGEEEFPGFVLGQLSL